MVKNQPTQNTKKQTHTPILTESALDRFTLSFEYNKTLQEIKREVRIRTI